MNLQINSILFKERPFVCVVKHGYNASTCACCFKRNIKLLTCAQCNRNCYCNRGCQKKDWKQHKLECKYFAIIPKKPNISDTSLITLRIMTRYKNGDAGDRDYLIENICGLKPRCFGDLLSNTFDDLSKISEGFDITVLELNSMLDCIGIDLKEFVTRDVAKTIFQKSVTNNFEIHDEINITIGLGCYLNGSSLDHSCWPNAVYSFVDNKLILMAIKDLAQDEKVYINYVDTLQLRDERRQHLRDQYLFECQCAACCNDELDREMSQLYCEYGECRGSVLRVLGTGKYQCDTCGVLVDAEVMAFKHSVFKAKLNRIDQQMTNRKYDDAYEDARQELDYFHLDNQPMNSGGLMQLCFGEKAFESAIFLGDYESALELCRMKRNKGSWIHERLVTFLGNENHPSAVKHLEKFHRILGIL